MPFWIDDVTLDRPEYVKQPEAILTDLLWRSRGSTLCTSNALNNLRALTKDNRTLERLVFRSRMGRAIPIETYGLAKSASQTALFDNNTGDNPYEAILNSLSAPRARGSKSGACVPIEPSLVLLQTLHGLANKNAPPNMAKIVENAAWHGGAPGNDGFAASAFLSPFGSISQVSGGLTGLMSKVSPVIADTVWQSYPAQASAPPTSPWPPTPLPTVVSVFPSSAPSPYSHHVTPFKWFWKYWETLCDLNAGWFNALPARRWTDWAICLLRTGLSFAYLWEAQLLFTIEEAAREHASGPRGTAWQKLADFLGGQYTVARFEDPDLPQSQRNCIEALRRVLQDGNAAREVLRFSAPPPISSLQSATGGSSSLLSLVDAWLNNEGQSGAGKPDLTDRYMYETLPKNTYEFVRYAMLQRPSDDDTWDQADFYYLARIDKSRRCLWFEPGPEWLVVIVSLCSGTPKGTCTLRELQRDLRLLGIYVDREILVKMLENYGLSTDSPDADEAIVIRSGF